MWLTNSHRVELSTVEISSDGDGFVLGFQASNREVHRMELPRWAVHQLMRLLPRIDAAMSQAHGDIARHLVAYPVVQWCLEPAGHEAGVALSLRDARHVESAYFFDAAEAFAVYAALNEVIGRPCKEATRTCAR